jgi:hypothetical protein
MAAQRGATEVLVSAAFGNWGQLVCLFRRIPLRDVSFPKNLLFCLSTARLRYASVGVVGVDSLDGKYGQKLD